MPAQYARQTAVPCTLSELQSGEWVQNSGLEPSGVKTDRGFVSRASVFGVLVGKQDSSLIIEDGTGKIAARTFETPVLANVGDLVHAIGRPREFNGERYVALEICRRLKSPTWITYRKKELELFHQPTQPIVQKPIIHEQKNENPLELILTRIRQLDNGPGVMIDELLNVVPNAEDYVKTLLEEGEIFEIRPGKVKVLE